MFRNALKVPKAERKFFCSSVFLEADHSGKMGKTKKDTNARAAGQRKQLKESAAEQLCVVNCAWIIFQSIIFQFVDIGFIGVSVKIPVIALKFQNFYITFLFSSLDVFARLIR